MKERYGYVRVSSKDQSIERQMAAMDEAGISKEKIYIDKQSGKDFNRPWYKKLVKKLKSGDEVYIKSIDRLGRNYDEIIEQWRTITRVKDAEIIVLDFPLLDTRNQISDITGRFVADLVLQILSYVAQVERENTHQRQMEGIKEAKKKGVQFGRPKTRLPEDFLDVAKQCKMKKISKRQGARLLNTNHTTFIRWLAAYEEKEIETSEKCQNL